MAVLLGVVGVSVKWRACRGIAWWCVVGAIIGTGVIRAIADELWRLAAVAQ
ncbi:MAG: hypothetical protein U0636_01360 [Phycisphaerales bacterium]